MPSELAVRPVFQASPAVAGKGEDKPRILEAAAERSIIQEDPDGPMLPPAGASRADTVFATVGIILLLILAVSFLWTLLRQRRR
jgi:hypothetical protein